MFKAHSSKQGNGLFTAPDSHVSENLNMSKNLVSHALFSLSRQGLQGVLGT